MAQIHFDITADSSNVVAAVKNTSKALRQLAQDAAKWSDEAKKSISSPVQYVEALRRAIADAEESIEEYNRQLNDLANQALEASLKGDEKAAEALGKQMENLSEKIRGAQNSIINCKQSLIMLGESSEGAGDEVEDLNLKSRDFNDIIRILPVPLKNIAQSARNVIKAAKAFIKTPIGATLAAIAAALAVINTLLTKTAHGQAIVMRVADAFDRWSVKILGVSKRMKELETATREGYVKELAEFYRLQKMWEQAGNDIQKQTAVRLQTNEKLGTSLRNLKQTEDLYTKDAKNFIEALHQKARAAALFELAVEKIKKAEQLKESPSPATLALATQIGQLPLPAKWKSWLQEKLIKAPLEEAANQEAQGMNYLTQSTEAEAEWQKLMKKWGWKDNRVAEHEKQSEEYKQLLDRIAREIKQKQIENELSTRQAEIDAMKEGSEKVRAQMRLNYEKEKVELDRWYDGLRDEKIELAKQKFNENPDNNGLVFTYNRGEAKWNATAQEDALYLAQQRALYQNYIKQQKQLWDEEVEEYGSYYEKRAQIAEKWEKRIAGLQSGAHRKSAERQRDKELRELDNQYNTTYQKIFADMDGMSADMIRATIGLAEAELQNLAATGKGAADEFKALSDRIQQLKGLEYSERHKGYGTTIEDIRAARYRRDLLAGKATEANNALQGYVDNFGIGIPENLRKVLVQTTPEYIKLAEAADRAKKALANANSELENTNSVATMIVAGGVITELANTLSNAGVEGADEFAEAISVFVTAISNVAQEKYVQAGVGIISYVLGKTVSSITEANEATKEWQKNVDNITRAFKLLDLTIDESKFKTVFGTDEAGRAAEAAKVRARAIEEYEKAVSAGYKIQNKYSEITYFGRSGYDAYKEGNIFGRGNLHLLNSDVFDTNGNILDVNKAQTWLNAQSQISDELREFIQNLINLKKAENDAQAAMESFAESLLSSTASDLASEMVDNFIESGDAIADMTDNMSDFAKALAKSYVKSMLMEQVFGKNKDAIIEALGKGEEGVPEAIRLFNEAADGANALAPSINAFLQGIQGFLGTATGSAPTSTGGAFQTMSETTGTELNGRFTAIQISNDKILIEAVKGTELLASSNIIIGDIRDLQSAANNTLADILTNTKKMLGFGDKLDAIQQNTSRL